MPKTPEPPVLQEGTITKLQVQHRNPERVSVYLGDAFAFGLHQDLLLAFGLHRGRVLTVAEQEKMLAADAVLVAKARALHYLSHRPRTQQEIRRKLQEKGTPPEAIEPVLARLEELGYLDDAAFARQYVAARFRNRGYGPQRLRRDLWQKGVAPALIDVALAEMLDEDETYAKALAQAEKRWPRLAREADPRKRRKKLSDFLLRRGFSFDTIRRVLDALAARAE